MTILKPFVAMINDSVTPGILNVLSSQLFLTEIISINEFTLRVNAQPNYPTIVHNQNLRVLVLKKLYDKTYNDVADIILFSKDALISVEHSKCGNPGLTFQVSNIQIFDLFYTPRQPRIPCDSVSLQYSDHEKHFPIDLNYHDHDHENDYYNKKF